MDRPSATAAAADAPPGRVRVKSTKSHALPYGPAGASATTSTVTARGRVTTDALGGAPGGCRNG